MLAQTVKVEDLGQADIAPNSLPVVAPDGRSVIYLKNGNPRPVVFHNLTTGTDTQPFNVPTNSLLWTLDFSSGGLLFGIPKGSGDRHIVEYSTFGSVLLDFQDAPPGGSSDDFPCVSPNGDSLAFFQEPTPLPTTSGTLYVRDATSRASTPNVIWHFQSGVQATAMQWLGDRSLLFSGQSVDGTQVTNETVDVSTGILTIAQRLGLKATPDPSGERIAWVQATAGISTLWLSRIDGGAMTELSTTAESILGLNWSLDGRAIVYKTGSSHLILVTLPPFR